MSSLKLTDSHQNEPRTSVRAVFHAGGGAIFVRCSARAKARGSMGLRMFRPTESVSLSYQQGEPRPPQPRHPARLRRAEPALPLSVGGDSQLENRPMSAVGIGEDQSLHAGIRRRQIVGWDGPDDDGIRIAASDPGHR